MIVVDFHQNKGQFIVAIVWPCTTDKRTDVWSRGFMIWKSILGCGLWPRLKCGIKGSGPIWATCEASFFTYHKGREQGSVLLSVPCTLVMFHFDPVHVKFFWVVNCNILQDGPKLICDGIVYITFFIGFVAIKGQIKLIHVCFVR